MMLRHGDPACLSTLKMVAGNEDIVGVDPQRVVEPNPQHDGRANQAGWHTVAVAAHLNIAIPADLAVLKIGCVVALRRKGSEERPFASKALSDHFMDGAVDAQVGLVAQPLLSELVEMRPAVEGRVAHEEMVLDIADHALIFAFGASAVGPTGARRKAIMGSQIDKACSELETVVMVEQHSNFLIVDEHLLRNASEVLEAADETVVGVLGIQAGGTPKVEATPVAELVDDEEDLGELASELNADLTPVALKLAAR